MNLELKEIKIGDIVTLKSIEEYVEDGDELTELVEQFAGHTAKVISISKEINEFGERMYTLIDFRSGDFVTATDHEIAKIYKEL